MQRPNTTRFPWEADGVMVRSFESPPIGPGQPWSFTFEQPGTYPCVCDLHAGREGIVTVAAGC